MMWCQRLSIPPLQWIAIRSISVTVLINSATYYNPVCSKLRYSSIPSADNTGSSSYAGSYPRIDSSIVTLAIVIANYSKEKSL